METHFTAQMRELNENNLFRSSLMLSKAVSKSRSDVKNWFLFRQEEIRCQHGLHQYDRAIEEAISLIADLTEHTRDGKIENQSYIPSLLIKTKLLLADCFMKLKHYQKALQNYKLVAFSDHTLESMMNMATCAALMESEHSAGRFYVEILNRWPYAFEAVYELAKLHGNLEVVLNSLSLSASEPEHAQEGDKVKFHSSSWYLQIYKAINGAIESYEGGVSYMQALDAEHATETAWELICDRSSKNPYFMAPVRSCDAGCLQLVCIQMAMCRGAYGEISKMLTPRTNVGFEYFGWALLRSSSVEALRQFQAELVRSNPFRWETWYVSSLKEWIDKRMVMPALELLSRVQVIVPTNTLVLVTRAYMCIYRVNDGLLHLLNNEDDIGSNLKRTILESAKSAELAIRDAWALSRDPFVTTSLLHIFSLIANYIPDSKVMEMVAEVVALNPLLKRFQSQPQTFLPTPPTSSTHAQANKVSTQTQTEKGAQGSNTPPPTPRQKTLARMLAMKAKLCLTKPGLTQVALDAANHATALDPQNIFARCMLSIAQAQKAGFSSKQTLDSLNGILEGVESREGEDIVKKEILPFLDKQGDLNEMHAFVLKLAQRHSLDEYIVFWLEHTKIRIRLAEEAEEAGEEEQDQSA